MKTDESVKKYWVSWNSTSGPCTVQVDVSPQGNIVWTAPLLMRFRGQPFSRLEAWLKLNLFDARIEPL
jgi:hypothetical protein